MTDGPFIDEELIPDESIQEVEDLPDGSTVFNILNGGEEEEQEQSDKDFYSNLAEDIEPSKLGALAVKLIEYIDDDIQSRDEWQKPIEIALKFLGFKVEEASKLPFVTGCGAFDTTLSIALYKSVATAYAELYPAAGPTRCEITGVPTQESDDAGERVRLFMNHYLTQIDDGYYPDSWQHLAYTIFFGLCAKKVYQDPISNKPESRMVKPFDLIFNNNCSTVESSSRITQVMDLSKKEIMLRERDGYYLPSNIGEETDDDYDESSIEKTIKNQEGVSSKDTSDKKSQFVFYELHIDLDSSELCIDGQDKLPKPYIVTICNATKKIVAIRRNWEEDDTNYDKIQYFVVWRYLPGFGMYGVGLAHLIGSNAITLTSIIRQLIDAGMLKNFPGGLKKRGVKSENNDKSIGPGEFHEIDVDGPIQESIMLMPYAEPSTVLAQLYDVLGQKTSALSMAAEAEIPEIGANAPVGTTLAMLEVANKVQSSVLRSFHKSLGNELKLLFKLFGKYLPEEPYPFAVPGSSTAIMKKDFSDRINIVPVSDPNVLTSTHRLIRAESILKLAQSAPELHNMREVYKIVYASMNLDNVDKILAEEPKPSSLDALSEIAYIMGGKPVTAVIFQDHDSHIMIKTQSLQDPMIQQNPASIVSLKVNIQEHKAYNALNEHLMNEKQALDNHKNQIIQNEIHGAMIHPSVREQMFRMGQEFQMKVQQVQQMSVDDILKIPEVQNIITTKDAKELQEQIQQQQEQMQEQDAIMKSQQIDPNAALLADINQRREASVLKDEEAKLKAETEAFKAQLKFEGDMAKMEAQERMAEEKNEVDLTIEQLKHGQV